MTRRALLGLWAGLALPLSAGRLCFDPPVEALGAYAKACGEGPRVELPAPGVNLEIRVASATRSPWIVHSGWRFLREPEAKFRYEPPAGKAALAIAEAFVYGADAGFRLDPKDYATAARLLEFLASVPRRELPPLADFAFVDDGSATAGEVVNLLLRRNLLFELASKPDPRYELNVVIGSPEFPRELASNPGAFATAVRGVLGDERRSIRIYGTEMAIVRAAGDGHRARLQVINYSGAPLRGVRLRLRGVFGSIELRVFGHPEAQPTDVTTGGGFTEFTIPEMGVLAIADLE